MSSAAAKEVFNVPLEKGVFKRAPAAFRNFVAKGSKDFPPEAGRYHLYLAKACPWCHRTDLTLALKGLSRDHVSVSFVETRLMQADGWSFSSASPDPLHGRKSIGEVYRETAPEYTGRLTVPVLYDKQTRRIVSNESSEIIRMLNTEFNDVAANAKLDLYPSALQSKIDETNEWVLRDFNNGVYQAGFATAQEAYDDAATRVFAATARLDKILAASKYLMGDELTEADVRAFPTALRFDPVYHFHFKLNKHRMEDFPNLWRWLKLMYQTPGVKATIDIPQTVEHYYWSHTQINPFRIIPQLESITDKLERDDDGESEKKKAKI
ncbi:hypothetical protein BASA81_003662 [Batrachochytrium salamandrivorans]|nr:hypothetical protein BASA81_003662 [Batrachochytrium salamandrivorans]